MSSEESFKRNVETFKKNLTDVSYVRAGWDCEMSPEQRHKERTFEREALASARSIWSSNPDMHNALRAAFSEISPLASMSEIEKQSI